MDENLVALLQQRLAQSPPAGWPTTVRRAEPAGNTYEAVNVANVPTVIRRVTVPRGCVWGPNLDWPLVLLLPFAETVTFAGTHVATNLTYRPARVPKINDAAEADGQFQSVALKTNGTVRTITAVGDHIDGVTGTVTCSDDTAADHRVAYVPYSAGRVKLYVKTPGTIGDYRRLIFDRDLAQVHAGNQQKEGKLRFPCFLPEDFAVEVELTAAWVWASVAGCDAGDYDLTFAAIDIPVTQYSLEQSAFYMKGEQAIGDTLKLLARSKIAGF